jgi:hypothetical protein
VVFGAPQTNPESPPPISRNRNRAPWKTGIVVAPNKAPCASPSMQDSSLHNSQVHVRKEVFPRRSIRTEPLSLLSLSLLSRSQFFTGYCTQDVNDALDLLSRCVNDASGSLRDRRRLACLWVLGSWTRFPWKLDKQLLIWGMSGLMGVAREKIFLP